MDWHLFLGSCFYKKFADNFVFNSDIGSWDTSGVTDMTGMVRQHFSLCSKGHILMFPWSSYVCEVFWFCLQHWKPQWLECGESNVHARGGEFRSGEERLCFFRPSGALTHFLLTTQFSNAIYNGPLNAWNTSRVTKMSFMVRSSRMSAVSTDFLVVLFCIEESPAMFLAN